MAKSYLKLVLTSAFSGLIFLSFAQEIRSPKSDGVLFVPAYAFQIPVGDISERFGTNSNIGGAIYYKFGQNWIIGAESSFIFGPNVKENTILDSFLTENNLLITSNGLLTEFGLFERGFTVYGKLGKVLSFSSANPNSGLLVMGGLGFMSHRIFINLDERDFPYLDETYRTGYDRLTTGFSASQFIGYAFINPDKFVNFYIGVELNEGFTKMRRNWQFDLNTADTEAKFDLLIGLKIGWIIPKFFGASSDDFIY